MAMSEARRWLLGLLFWCGISVWCAIYEPPRLFVWIAGFLNCAALFVWLREIERAALVREHADGCEGVRSNAP